MNKSELPEDQEKLLERIRQLEEIMVFTQAIDNNERKNADPDQLKEEILENIEKIQDLKENYPVEMEQDQRVTKAIVSFEKELKEMVNKLDKGVPLDETEVKDKVEKDENKLIADTTKIVNEMKRKSAYLGLSDIPSKRGSESAKSNDVMSASKPIEPFEERKSLFLGIPPSKPQRKSVMKKEEATQSLKPIDPSEERKSIYTMPFQDKDKADKAPQTRKSVWKGQDQLAQSILIPESKPIEPSLERKSMMQKEAPGVGQRKSVWKGQDQSLNVPTQESQVQQSSSSIQPSKTPTFQSQISPPQNDLQSIRKSIWKAAEDEIYKNQQPKSDKKVSFTETPKTPTNPIKNFDSISEENEVSNRSEEDQDETAGEFMRHVQLTGCSGSITVIKIVRETDLAVGYSTGELALYSINDDFKLKSKGKEHFGSISALESGNLNVDEGGSGLKNLEVIMTGGNEADKTVVVWDAFTLQPLKRLNGHQHMVTSIVDIGDSATFVTSSMDGQIAFWNMRNPEPECIQILEDLRFPIITMKFDFDDGVLTAGTIDGQIGMWQLLIEDDLYVGCSLIRIVEMQGHVIEILRTSCLPRALITLESDFCIREYDLSTGKLSKTIRSDKPLIDVFLVEKAGAKKVILFTVDNANNLHRIKDWGKAPARMTLARTRDAEVSIKRYIGYNPRSQIFIKAQELLLITCDQSNQKLEINKLNIVD